MSVGLKGLPGMHAVAGLRVGATAAGIRRKERPDLVVIECVPGTRAAAVFTRNRFCAAPVLVAREHLSRNAPRALLINTGYANAGTGEAGVSDARACCEALARQLDSAADEVLPFSTGVIGERLPLDRIIAGIPACVAGLRATGWEAGAYGIMTTDTMPKGSSRRVDIDGASVTVTGIAKGAGMIRPDMATMLAFIGTDAKIADRALQRCLEAAVNESFNRITVDGDTSTNDACLLLATGQAAHAEIAEPGGEAFSRLSQAVREVCLDLAQAIIRDAEGVTKFITIEVEAGASEADCLAVAYTIAHSPLVKTAFFASDPNWGRILAAIGRAPIPALDIARVAVYLDDVCIARNGARAEDYTEARGQAVMKREEITIRVSLGAGEHRARVWTSDLSHDYVRINAEYRT